jgi:probable HAF family extracellular repeat protein
MIGWALLCLAIGSPVLAADYRFGTVRFPDSVMTSARGINARGHIVGHYESRDGATHAFLLRKETYTTLDFPGSLYTSAKGINARGEIVGDFTDTQGGQHAYLLSDGQFTQIDYPGASATIAFHINNAGDITGRWYDQAGGENGFLLKNRVFHRVKVPGGGISGVFGAQDNGRVMAGDISLESGLYGFLRTGPSHYELIDYPGPEPVEFTVVRWINQRGDVVGVTGFGDEPTWFGFLFRDGQYTRIDVDFQGATTTRPLAINDDGVIVGDYVNRNGAIRGFRALPDESQP